jgi:hypothetical protein
MTLGRALVIGLDPARLSGWDPAPVLAGIARGRDRFVELGIDADFCLVAPDGRPEADIAGALSTHDYACVVVGGGLRDPSLLGLLETAINLIRRHAPDAALAFNSTPDGTPDAALRWLRPAHTPPT